MIDNTKRDEETTMEAGSTPSMAQIKNRYHGGHRAILWSIISGTKLVNPTLFHLRSEQTLRRWDCLASDGTLTAKGRELATAMGIKMD